MSLLFLYRSSLCPFISIDSLFNFLYQDVLHLFPLQVTRNSIIKREKKKFPFTLQNPQVICQKQASEINHSNGVLAFWFDESLGRFLSRPFLTYSRTQNNYKPVQHVLSVLGSLHIFTAFDTLGDWPRGARNNFSWRWSVATNRMIHSGFQLAPYRVSRKCPSGAGSVWRNCPEIPDAII